MFAQGPGGSGHSPPCSASWVLTKRPAWTICAPETKHSFIWFARWGQTKTKLGWLRAKQKPSGEEWWTGFRVGSFARQVICSYVAACSHCIFEGFVYCCSQLRGKQVGITVTCPDISHYKPGLRAVMVISCCGLSLMLSVWLRSVDQSLSVKLRETGWVVVVATGRSHT